MRVRPGLLVPSLAVGVVALGGCRACVGGAGSPWRTGQAARLTADAGVARDAAPRSPDAARDAAVGGARGHGGPGLDCNLPRLDGWRGAVGAPGRKVETLEVRRGPVIKSPFGVAVDGAGRVYVAQEGSLLVIDKGDSRALVKTSGDAFRDVAVDRRARVFFIQSGYAGTPRRGRLMLRVWERAKVRTLLQEGSFKLPRDGPLGYARVHGMTAVAVGPGDVLYVGVARGIVRVAGGRVTTLTRAVTWVTGLAVDGRGRVFGTDDDIGGIFRLEGTGVRRIVPAAACGAFPPMAGLAIGPRGRIFASGEIGDYHDGADLEGWGHRIYVYDRGALRLYAGGATDYKGFYRDGPAHVAGFGGPRGLAVDRRGRVYVADYYNHRIRIIIP